MDSTSKGEIFSGLRVLDCTRGLAGPLASMQLADFGADVLKVEVQGGESMRARPAHRAFNRNKRSVALALGSPELRELVRDADVVLVDARAAELDACGLDAARLCAAQQIGRAHV